MSDNTPQEERVQLNIGMVPKRLRDALAAAQNAYSDDGTTPTLAETLERLLADKDALTKLFYQPEDQELASMRLAIDRNVTNIAEIFTTLMKRSAEQADIHAQQMKRLEQEATVKLEAAAGRIDELEQMVADRDRQRMQAEEALAKERQMHAEVVGRYKTLEQAVEQLGTERERVAAQLTALQQAAADAERVSRQAREELASDARELRGQLDEAERRQRSMAAELQGAQVARAAVEGRAGELEAQAARDAARAQSLEQRLADAMATIRELSTALSNARKEPGGR